MPVVEYTPRDPSASAIYAVVRAHVEGFLAEATRLRDGDGVLRFVEAEFRAFLRCGFLAGGFARFRCTGCTTERHLRAWARAHGVADARGGGVSVLQRFGGSVNLNVRKRYLA